MVNLAAKVCVSSGPSYAVRIGATSLKPSLDNYSAVRLFFVRSRLQDSKCFLAKSVGGRVWIHPSRKFRVLAESKTEELQIRKCAPLLEKETLLASNNTDVALASDDWSVVPDIWRSSAEKYGDRIALVDPYHDPPTTMTYKQLEQEILKFSEGLRIIGLKPEEKVSFFADNSCRWLVADQGIMAMGAINVVRGSRSSVEELLQIYEHSESVGLVVDNPEFFNRISEVLVSKAKLRFVILLWGKKSQLVSDRIEGVPNFSYKELIELGRQGRVTVSAHPDAKELYKYESISSDDIAALMYTSGTTGNPKGVMLTHKNLLHQIKNLWDVVPAVPGDRFLSMLPPWHAYERAVEYFTLTHGSEQVYTTVKNLKDDLRRYQPHYMISVPLVYETLYNGIQKQIHTSPVARKFVALTFLRVSLAYMEFKRIYEGLCLTRNEKQPSYLFSALEWLLARIIAAILWPLHVLAKKLVYSKIHSSIGITKAGVSGGGHFPSHVDKFFEAIDVKVQNGYGLTESSPVVACRRRDCNVLGSIGYPINHTEFKIVDPETNAALPIGSKGIVKFRGPPVMKGYFKNPTATMQAVDEDGWLNSGDLGWIAPQHSVGRSRRCGGVIVLEGRAKDTIVLSTGENVEPQELEEAASRSSLVQQIVVIGQDQRRVGAIIVPNKDEILSAAKHLKLVDAEAFAISREKMTSLLYEDLRKWTSECSFQIGPIFIVDEPFTIDSGLMTPTMKIRRDRVVAKFKDEIAKLYR